MQSEQESTEYSNFAVARQAIFDAKGKIFGYELLYRSFGDVTINAGNFNDAATIEVLAHGIELASQFIPHEKKLFVNFPRSLLEKNIHAFLNKDRFVIEILECDVIDQGYLKLIKQIKADGFTLALDDYAGEDVPPEIFSLVEIVKIDLLLLGDLGRIKELISKLAKLKLQLLAEKVETDEVYKTCRESGCSFFQGFFFCKPTLLKGKALSPSEATKVNLVAELSKPDFDFDKVGKILSNDAVLSYKLLKYTNSPSKGQSKKIESIDRAVMLMGQRGLRQWLSVNILSSLSQSEADKELVFLSALRGKFLTMFHQKSGQHCLAPADVSLIGLFSLLDALLKTPMPEIVKSLNVDEFIKKGLVGGNAPCLRCLELVSALESGDEDRFEKLAQDLGLSGQELRLLYLEAMTWTLDVFVN